MKRLTKSRSRKGRCRFHLRISAYGNWYYVDRIAKLEAVLNKKPRSVQIDLVGAGEISADAALLMRSVLMKRSAGTRIITNARSSLHNGSVLVWLQGDQRIIRDDARLYFRRCTLPEKEESKPKLIWKNDEAEFCDSFSEIEPEEGDYARVLELINEFLPVNEMAGRLIEVPVLRQFGLIENEKVDQFLTTAFSRSEGALVRR